MSEVLASLVTRNDEADIERCLESLQRQSLPVHIRILDNDSSDATVQRARKMGVEVACAGGNTGYSSGHNFNLDSYRCRFALFLNADTILEPDYVETLAGAFERHSGVGMAGGRVARMDGAGGPLRRDGGSVLDTTGIYFAPSQRHFDRGSDEVDRGQYDRTQLVFGISGALLMARRRMLDQVRIDGEVFDTDFFAYREDADLAWRAQLAGWHALYVPQARALHRRVALPQRRRHLPQALNYHSLKNRYLMRIKNMDRAVFWRCFPFHWLRDAGIRAYVLALERSSLPAYRRVRELRPRFLEKRRLIQQQRRAGPRSLVHWFSFRPKAIDIEP